MKILGDIADIETIARGRGIREYALLITRYGGKNWLRRKGVATVEVEGVTRHAEIHWYECHGIGKVKLKVKRWL